MNKSKQLLPQTHFFKTNLHCHSNLSDGRLSPCELKDAYKAKGYGILAITDHNIIADHSAMSEPDFLMLTGMEININHQNYRTGLDGQSCHLNLIAKRPDNLWTPTKTYNRFPAALEYEKKMQCEEMDITHTTESINAMIAKANEMGFLVSYNHPVWSCHSYPDYAHLNGLWGLELRNSESVLSGINENNAQIFKDLLNLGNRVYPIGADDSHTLRSVGQSWIMLGVAELCYDNVIKALENGDFYMSCGPEFFGITIENNTLKITCSDAQQITLESHGRFARCVVAEGDTWVREASFDLSNFIENANDSMYIRLTVTAPDGTYAATRAYYLNEII